MLPRKMKLKTVRIIIACLIVYLAIMSYIGRGMLINEHRPWAYFGTIAAELTIIVTLYFVLKKRAK